VIGRPSRYRSNGVLEVFGGATAAAGVAARHDVRLDVLGQLFDVRRVRVVQSSVAI
jgi:hypothetical protein